MKIRKIPQEAIPALVAEVNRMRVAAVSSNVHYSTTRVPGGSALTVSAANASSEATSIALCRNIIAVLRQHAADSVAHKLADPTELPEISDVFDLDTAIDGANACKAWQNTHRASTTYHAAADATNAIASADATDQTSLNTLLNEMKTDITAHIAAALAGNSFELV